MSDRLIFGPDDEPCGTFDDGVTWTISLLAKGLKVDPQSYSWDAATETYDGDVFSVLFNVLNASNLEGAAEARGRIAGLREAEDIARRVIPTFGPDGPDSHEAEEIYMGLAEAMLAIRARIAELDTHRHPAEGDRPWLTAPAHRPETG